LTTDLDLPEGDYQVDDLYFGTYNDATGALYRLRIRNGDSYLDPQNWSVEKVIDAGRPVFAAPTVTHDRNNLIWLYFGTGIYVNSLHIGSTNEKLFGLIEPTGCWKRPDGSSCSQINESQLYDTTDIQFANARAVKYACQCPGNITISEGYCYKDNSGNLTCGPCATGSNLVLTELSEAVLVGATGDLASCNNKTDNEAIQCIEKLIYNYNAETGQIDFTKYGWKRDLDGEKLYSSPRVTGGAVLATPFAPSTDPCAVGGSTKLLAVYYTTGTPYYQPIIRAYGGTTYTQLSQVTIVTEVEIAKGPPPTKESVVIKQQGGQTTAFTQASGGIIKTEITQPNPPKEMFIHWLTK
jgi:type IV pilus assembly protein PilY1